VQIQEQRAKLQQQRTEQVKVTLLWFGRWLSSGVSGVMFYFICLLVYVSLGFIAGVNFPSLIVCHSRKEFCYQLRWDKSKVVIPSEYNQQPRQKNSKNKS
jgi:hypothetical protein